ncbi:MAG: hypothetical protein R3B47_10605 [Bacteroidia bacterium]
MGWDVHIKSEIQVLDGANPIAFQLAKCEKTIDRRYFWFVEEHIFNQSESILSQLEKMLNIPISWLGEIMHSDELVENLNDENNRDACFLLIEPSLQKLIELENCLLKEIDVTGKFTFASDMSEVNKKYYPDYVQHGEFLTDIQSLLNTLDCYQKNGAKKFVMWYG